MSSIEQLYKIWRWKVVGPVPDGIPENGFKQDSDLLITRKDETQTCSLEWQNEPLEGCSITDLPLDIPAPFVEVFFGNKIVRCYLELKYSGDFVKGRLTCVPRGSDGNTGTFIAEAINPPDPV